MVYYDALNISLIKYIPKDSKSILDIGCGSGALGKFIKENINPKASITGITYSENEAVTARERLNSVIVADLNTFDFNTLGKFDLIICSHILEHLFNPSSILNSLQGNLTPAGKILIALPNILYWKQRMKFIKGHFKYSKGGGLMDDTHFRFFDWTTAQDLIKENNFNIIDSTAIGNFPLPLIRKVIPSFITNKIDQTFSKLLPGLLGFQFIFLVEPK